MNKPEPTASDIARLQEASEWVQRLNDSSEQALTDQWLQWCQSDQRNLSAFEDMQRMWDAFPAGTSITVGTSVTAPAFRPASRLRQSNRLIAWAAGIILAVGTAGWLTLHYPNARVLDTPIGKQRHITLTDGSNLDLAPGSRVSTRFTFTQRDVLLERGQAFFAVAHNTMRPFVVHVGGLTVRAVGTTFDVRTGPGSIVVTVGEGFVNVARAVDGANSNATDQAETLRVGVGQRVVFSKNPRSARVATVNPEIAGSWRSGTLQFVGEPLEDVVGAVNRYNTAQIDVAPALRQTRFTGTLSPTDIRDWLRALEQIYAVEVVDHGTNGLLIQSRAYASRG